MKRALAWIIGIIILVGALGAFALTRIDTRYVVDKIAEATASATGTPLLFEDAPSLSLLPPGVAFGKASWGSPDSGTGMAVSLKGGMAQLELSPLLSGQIVIHEIRLDSPVLEIHQPKQMADSLEAVSPAGSAPPEAPGSSATQPPRKAPDDTLPVELKKLTISQGAVLFVDADGTRLSLDKIDLSVENLRRREEAALQCSLAIDWRDADTAPLLTGQLTASALLRYYMPNLTFRQVALQLEPRAGLIPAQAGPLQLTCEGAIDLQNLGLRLASARLALAQGSLTLEGQGALQPPAFTGKIALDAAPRKLAALAGVGLKPAAKDRLTINGALEWAGTDVHLRQLRLQMDDTPATADCSLRLGSPLGLTLALQSGQIDLDNWLPLPQKATTGHTAAKPSDKKAGKGATAKTDKTALRPADMPSLDLRASASGIRHGKLLLKDVAVILKGEKGRYDLSRAAARLDSGGSLSATGAANVPGKTYALKAKGSNIQLGPLLEALGQGRPMEGLALLDADLIQLGPLLEALGQGRPMEGLALLDADLTTSGDTVTAVQAGLNGTGLVEIHDMRVQALRDLSGGVPDLAAKGSIPDTFDVVRVPFVAKNGEITARPVTVTSSKLNAQGQAHISLPRQHLDASAQVRTLGMNIPVVAHGPFSDISCGLDPKFALDMARQLPGVLLDTGKEAGTAAGHGASKTGDALRQGLEGAGGLVRGLLGR